MNTIEDAIPVLQSLGLSWVDKTAVEGDKNWNSSGSGTMNRYINLEDDGVALGTVQEKTTDGDVTTNWWVEDKNAVVHVCNSPEDAIVLAMYMLRFTPSVTVAHNSR